MSDRTEALRERVLAAVANGTLLRIRGGGTKDFYGQALTGAVLDTRAHRGIVAYEPSELFVTARSGTPLAELEAQLAAQGQMLGFEPPHFGGVRETASQSSPDGALDTGGMATLGGCIAAGLCGPRRATAGAARDFVLGVKLIDGRGDVLRFGGQVMKNVAGYDVARLMAGALGTLGLLLEVTLKVLPRPRARLTLRLELTQAQAIETVNRWGGAPLPLSATCWQEGVLCVRLCGTQAGVRAARARIGGEPVGDDEGFWRALRDQQAAFFAGEAPLWRLSLPSTSPPLALPGETLIEWGGAQRWLHQDAAPGTVRSRVAQAGGHATLFRGGSEQVRQAAGVFHPLPAPLMTLHRRLKERFDPHGLFNRGRLYPEF